MKSSTYSANIPVFALSALFCLILFSCSGKKEEAFDRKVACFKFENDKINSPAAFFDKVASIKLIPLDNNISGMISGTFSSSMAIDENDFIIYDNQEHSKICRFSPEGKFLNIIGQKGRGPKEYMNLLGVQLLGDTLLAYFSTNRTFLKYYNRKGEFIKSGELEISSFDLRKIGNDFLLGRGYGVANPFNRAVLKSPEGNKLFFETSSAVPAMGENTSMFNSYGGNAGGNAEYYLFREVFNDTIYIYSVKEKEFYPHAVFDLGEFAPGKSFFEQNDLGKAMQILFDKYGKEGFITTVRYMESDKILLGEFIHEASGGSRFIYLYDDKNGENAGKGEWFNLSDDGTSGFSGGIKQIYNGMLYCLLPPDLFIRLPDYIKSKITNISEIEGITEESNCVVAVLKMK